MWIAIEIVELLIIIAVLINRNGYIEKQNAHIYELTRENEWLKTTIDQKSEYEVQNDILRREISRQKAAIQILLTASDEQKKIIKLQKAEAQHQEQTSQKL